MTVHNHVSQIFKCPKEGLPLSLQKELGITALSKIEKIRCIAYKIFCYILFPLYVSGLLLTYLTRVATFPATIMFKKNPNDLFSWEEAQKRRLLERTLHEKKGQEIYIKTPDEAKLNGAFFEGKEKDKCILFCNPNAACFENIGSTFLDIAQEVGVSALLFNARGVSDSKGPLPNGTTLPIDAYSMVKFLILEKGIQPENILIYGYSLGGGYGSAAAALIQQEYPEAKISICSDRSFSKLSDTAYYLLKEKIWIPFIGRVLGYLAAKAITLTGFELDSKAALSKLKGTSIIISHSQDEIIRTSAQLSSPHPFSSTHIHLDENIPSPFQHGRIFSPQELSSVTSAIRQVLKISNIAQAI